MGAIKTSKYHALLVTNSSKAQAKGKSKKKEPKATDSKPKQNQQTSEGASGSKKNKKFKNKLSIYCEKGYHLEYYFMRKQLDEMSALLKQHNISPPQREKKPDEEPQTKDDERCHALKASLTQSTSYIIDSGASNHMVSSKESFSTLTLLKGPNIHMGNDSQIPAKGRGSAREEHSEFKNVLYVPSLATNLLFVYQMNHTGSPKRITFNS